MSNLLHRLRSIAGAIRLYEGGPSAEEGAVLDAAHRIEKLEGVVEALVECFIKRGPFDEPLGSSEQAPSINAGVSALAKAGVCEAPPVCEDCGAEYFSEDFKSPCPGRS